MAKELNTYSAYIHPVEGLEVVKVGFSWPGFLFGFIWAFVKRLWIVGALLLAVEVVPRMLGELFDDVDLEPLIGVMGFVIRLIAGVKGNDWRRNELESRGYELVGSVRAEDAEAALADFDDEQSA